MLILLKLDGCPKLGGCPILVEYPKLDGCPRLDETPKLVEFPMWNVNIVDTKVHIVKLSFVKAFS